MGRLLATITAASAFGLCVFASGLTSGAFAQNSIDGTYLDSGGFVEITVGPCGARTGSARCGRVTRIVRNKPGEPNHDRHNNNPELRSRPILGITILQDLRWEDDAWRGRVYNPEDGGTYRAVVSPARGGSLEVKGCVSIICRTRIWPNVS